MNEDYLWDKSGEPDPEIAHLERVLGTLRYQPQSFEVPRQSETRSSRTWLPLLAIAASVILAVAVGALWLALDRPATASIAQIQLPADAPQKPIIREVAPQPAESSTPAIAITYRKPIVRKRESIEKLMAERKEAEQAKQQLLLALRLTSSKLSIAQKKIQGTPGMIRNQHKAG